MARRKRSSAGLTFAQEAKIKGKLRGRICSEAWLDAQFHQVAGLDPKGEPCSALLHDPRRADPAFDPRTGRVRDDGGRCRRLLCRCCEVPTPLSGYAERTVRTESTCPRCGSRWEGEHLHCHRCGYAMTNTDQIKTCLCRDCAISGRPQETAAHATQDRRRAWQLFRAAVRIRRAQRAYGISPWRRFVEGMQRFELRLPWDRAR